MTAIRLMSRFVPRRPTTFLGFFGSLSPRTTLGNVSATGRARSTQGWVIRPLVGDGRPPYVHSEVDLGSTVRAAAEGRSTATPVG